MIIQYDQYVYQYAIQIYFLYFIFLKGKLLMNNFVMFKILKYHICMSIYYKIIYILYILFLIHLYFKQLFNYIMLLLGNNLILFNISFFN